MLVLSRKNRESVVVGGQDGVHRLLKVTVLEIGNGEVKLGFEVDADVPVRGLETWELIPASGKLASARVASRVPDVQQTVESCT